MVVLGRVRLGEGAMLSGGARGAVGAD
jgi:hypothetical protein